MFKIDSMLFFLCPFPGNYMHKTLSLTVLFVREVFVKFRENAW